MQAADKEQPSPEELAAAERAQAKHQRRKEELDRLAQQKANAKMKSMVERKEQRRRQLEKRKRQLEREIGHRSDQLVAIDRELGEMGDE